MKTKHTPGPWERKEHTGDIGKDLAGWWRIVAPARIQETQELFQRTPELATDLVAVLPAASEANAQLIAAAPDMLEALQNIENDDNHMPRSAWDLIQTAIAKATK